MFKELYYGVPLDDTLQCNSNDVCPSGSGSDSDSDESPRSWFYGAEVCKRHFCGFSLDDTSQCNDNDKCHSGSGSASYCSLGQSCYGFEVCKNIFVVSH